MATRFETKLVHGGHVRAPHGWEVGTREVEIVPIKMLRPLGGDYATVEGVPDRELSIGVDWHEGNPIETDDVLVSQPVYHANFHTQIGTRFTQARWVPKGTYQAAVEAQERRRNPPPKPLVPLRVPIADGKPQAATVHGLIAQLRKHAKLEVHHGRLLITARDGALGMPLREAVARYELLIVGELTGQRVSCWLCPERGAQPAVILAEPAFPLCEKHATEERR